MSEEGEAFSLDPGQTVILNALVDVYTDAPPVLDAESQRNLEAVVDHVATPDERATASDELDRLVNLESGEWADVSPELYQHVIDVFDQLSEEGYSISVVHEYRQQITPLDAHLYSYLNTHDHQRLESLDLTPAVMDRIREGTELLEEEHEAACAAIDAAVDASETETDELVSRIVAGWASFLSGDDETALTHAEQALELEQGSWLAHVVGTSVNRNQGDLIRSRKKSVGVVLRWSATGSERTSTRAELGKKDCGGNVSWSEIEHLGGHAYLEQLYPETWLRFVMRGDLPHFPELQMYYLGIGLYHNNMNYIEKVFERFGSGPNRNDTVERVSIHR